MRVALIGSIFGSICLSEAESSALFASDAAHQNLESFSLAIGFSPWKLVWRSGAGMVSQLPDHNI
jgi:hypothetical protein